MWHHLMFQCPFVKEVKGLFSHSNLEMVDVGMNVMSTISGWFGTHGKSEIVAPSRGKIPLPLQFTSGARLLCVIWRTNLAAGV